MVSESEKYQDSRLHGSETVCFRPLRRTREVSAHSSFQPNKKPSFGVPAIEQVYKNTATESSQTVTLGGIFT